ncbi:MAG: aspartate kinase [Vampirovibrionales bacterium]|nr:aspartate kinase [Vampirovibrionales bacterium]
MPIRVLKFGGTSVGDTDKIQRVAGIIQQIKAQSGDQVVAVVSAMGHSTDHLVDLAKAFMPIPSGREHDALLATGEMVSAALMAMALNKSGCPALSLNAWQAGMHTESVFNKARLLTIDAAKIRALLDGGQTVIVTGFQGINTQGDITTLGRGGSDTTAVALAAALNATQCDIFTDVRGVYSTDPRIVPAAVKLPQIAYIEMMELARLGAQVLHPRAVETARQWQVKLCVRSTFDLEDCGTMIVDESALQQTPLEGNRPVSGIAADTSQARIAVMAVPDQPGIVSRIFGALSEHKISVDMIIQAVGPSTQTNDVVFTVAADDAELAQSIVAPICTALGGQGVAVDTDIAKISIVGVGMIDRPGIAADMFAALAQAGINIKMIATSEIKISCLVEKAQAKAAVAAIHRTFFEGEAPQELPEPQKVLVDQKLGY